ncbi:cytochrome P450 [Sorangium sp. So ce590]|uniref:cytochrome P450 n=1 Tax=Sorangium sp. So ce590 TaxID=3133317 RepID=UPI003F646895
MLDGVKARRRNAGREAAQEREVLGDKDPGEESLSRLRLTRRVIDETLRLYPSAWMTDRWTLAVEHVGGYRIPADPMVLIRPYFVHRNPRCWKGPERFDPDRFVPERVAERPAHHDLPFGYGPRNCIGSRLALLELQILLPMLLSRYRFRVASARPLRTFAQVTLRSLGLKFRLEPRCRAPQTRP